VAEAASARLGCAVTRELFARAGLVDYLRAPPETMVNEVEVIALHAALRAELGAQQVSAVCAEAGRLTAEYLLANRIPRPAQVVLKRLPAWLAARVLLRAIGGHAWTFAGSGEFQARAGQPVVLQIANNPLCRGLSSAAPTCDYYAAVFQRLFEVLVHPAAQVVETACEARGDPVCRFEVRW
jgi:divinyl protochlorophyllide a 8-vinyl-reductase